MELSPQDICPVCVEALKSKEDLPVVATLCGHVFHARCLSTWFEQDSPALTLATARLPKEELLKGKCPVCSKSQWFRRCLKLYICQDDEESVYVTRRMKMLEEELQKSKKLNAELIEKQRLLSKMEEANKAAEAKVAGSRKRIMLPDVHMAPAKNKPTPPNLTMTLRSAAKQQQASIAAAPATPAQAPKRTASIAERRATPAASSRRTAFTAQRISSTTGQGSAPTGAQRAALQARPIVRPPTFIYQRAAPQQEATVKRTASMAQRAGPQPTSTVRRTASVAIRATAAAQVAELSIQRTASIISASRLTGTTQRTRVTRQV